MAGPQNTDGQDQDGLVLDDEDVTTLTPGDDDTTGGTDDADDDFGGADDTELQLARDNGWTPREEWKGAADKWVDAKAFADRSKSINGLLQNRLKTQEAEMAQMRADMREFQERQYKGDVAAIDEDIASLEVERAEAISNADGAAVVDTERRLVKLRADKAALDVARTKRPAVAEPQVSDDDKAFAAQFVADNPWMNDERIGVVTLAIGAKVRKERPDLVGNIKGFLTELRARMRKDYAELIGERTTMRNSRTEGSGTPPRGPSRTKGKTYADLPAEAKVQCDRMVRNKMVRKPEDYVKNYFAENPNG